MKKSLLLGSFCALMLLLMQGTKANAQITNVSIDSAGVNTWWGTCSIPDTIGLNFSGTVVGAVPNDSLNLYVNFGDGNDTNMRVPVWTQGTWGGFYSYIDYAYQTAGTFNVMFTATSDNNVTDTVYSGNFVLTNSCAPLSGQIYMDANNNCIFDAGTDNAFAYTGVSIAQVGSTNMYYASCDVNGNYSANVPTGFSYTITPYTGWMSSITPTCPTGGTITVAVPLGGSLNNNFAYSCNTTSTDYSVTGWANNWRPGFTRPLTVTGQVNSWCDSTPAVITVVLPSQLTYSGSWSSTPSYVSATLDTISWNMPYISAWGWNYESMDVLCDPNATMGDTLCATVYITTNPADANPVNNVYTVCAEVNNSYDPNDKAVSPQGNGPQGFIAAGTELTYHVRFQNTGNDVAYTVQIDDEIDAGLDMSTLRVLGASHAMQPYIVNHNSKVIFRFDNINLPDSGSNEPASHGFVTYAIKAKNNLAPGVQINNTAHIFFDFNEAIITNTTLNTINIPTTVENVANKDVAAAIYPNPANGNINIEVKNAADYTAELYDITGRQVNITKGNNSKAVMNVAAQANGTYLLRIVTSAGKVLTTKVSVQH